MNALPLPEHLAFRCLLLRISMDDSPPPPLNGTMSHTTKPAPTLDTLPSELRRLIVAHLAPSGPEELRPGCKAPLKSANLAHPCLREWVPEFMFRDMALEHVIVGMASFLERFAVNEDNAGLLKHVKTIQVKVSYYPQSGRPPADSRRCRQRFDGKLTLSTTLILSKT